ncbi:hypothetical protein HanPSC8_Chr09g0351081 [Helianthus annuus]|nr:hypothetical protein HanPSC8_Chr09g0351081 [Helianthus annuus]
MAVVISLRRLPPSPHRLFQLRGVVAEIVDKEVAQSVFQKLRIRR